MRPQSANGSTGRRKVQLKLSESQRADLLNLHLLPSGLNVPIGFAYLPIAKRSAPEGFLGVGVRAFWRAELEA